MLIVEEQAVGAGLGDIFDTARLALSRGVHGGAVYSAQARAQQQAAAALRASQQAAEKSLRTVARAKSEKNPRRHFALRREAAKQLLAHRLEARRALTAIGLGQKAAGVARYKKAAASLLAQSKTLRGQAGRTPTPAAAMTRRRADDLQARAVAISRAADAAALTPVPVQLPKTLSLPHLRRVAQNFNIRIKRAEQAAVSRGIVVRAGDSTGGVAAMSNAFYGTDAFGHAMGALELGDFDGLFSFVSDAVNAVTDAVGGAVGAVTGAVGSVFPPFPEIPVVSDAARAVRGTAGKAAGGTGKLANFIRQAAGGSAPTATTSQGLTAPTVQLAPAPTLPVMTTDPFAPLAPPPTGKPWWMWALLGVLGVGGVGTAVYALKR